MLRAIRALISPETKSPCSNAARRSARINDHHWRSTCDTRRSQYSTDEIELLSIISDAPQAYQKKAMLYEEVGGLKEALETRKLVERAKGILMKRHGISEQDSFARIQHQARSSRKTMREIAEAIILAEEV
jgi:hypothetical protein